MAPNITINMSGDDAEAIRAFQKVMAEERKLAQGLAEIGRENAKSASEAKKLEDAAKRVWEQTRTPLERYNQKVEELDRLLAKTKMTQDTYNSAVAKAKQEYEAAENAGEKAFGAGAIGKLASYAGGVLSIATAITTATSALNDMEAARADAAAKAQSSRMGLGSLAQVAESPEEMQSLVGAARNLYRQGGAGSVDEAARTVFNLKSSDQMQFLKMFEELRSSGMVSDPSAMAEASGALMSAMGSKETGDVRAIVSKGLAAAIPGAGTVEQILSAAAKSGTSAAALGMRDEEVLASTAILSKSMGPEEAKTRLSALLKVLDIKQDFKGSSLKDAVGRIQAMGMGGEETFNYFGRSEAVEAYRTMVANMGEYESALSMTDRAQAEDIVGKKLRYFQSDPSLAAAKAAEESTAAEELSRENLGTYYNRAEAIDKQISTLRRTQGASEWGGWLRGKGAGLTRWAMGEEGYTQGVSEEMLREVYRERPDIYSRHIGNQIPLRHDAVEGTVPTLQGPITSEQFSALIEAMKEMSGAARALNETSRSRRDPATSHADQQ